MNVKDESKIVAAALLLKLNAWALEKEKKKSASPADNRHLKELLKLIR